MNSAELYLLGRELMEVGVGALPVDSALCRMTPAARLVLEDVALHPGTFAAETAERTGLSPGEVSLLAGAIAAEDLAETKEEPNGTRIRARGGPLSRSDSVSPVDEALAAALDATDAAEVREVVGVLESLARRLASRTAPRSGAAHQQTPAWETGRPQPALAELVAANAVQGRVLDVGCGTGEHALMAAGLGLSATGIDVSPAAIKFARRKSAERGLPVRFTVHDALDLAALGEQFDTVIDSALFHVFTDDDRARYAAALRQVLPVGGRYLMLCCSDSDEDRGDPPPRRVRREEIDAVFADGWQIDEVTPATLEVTTSPVGMRAWRVALTRL